MSGRSYEAVWQTPWPSPYHFAVAMVLARYQNREGFCYMRQRKMAELAYCSVRQVGKVLQDMRTATPPQIELVEQRRPDGSQGTNLVRLTLSAYVDSRVDPLVTAADFYPDYSADPDAQYAQPSAPGASGGLERGAIPPPEHGADHKRARLSKSKILKDSTPSATEHAQRAFEAYNLLAKRLGLSVAESLTEGRAKKLLKRIEEVGLEGWNRVLQNVEKSKFLCGEARPTGDRRAPFRASLDFLLQASSFQKVLEGQYGHDRRVSVGDDAAQAQAFQARMLGDRAFMLNLVTRWTQDPASWPALAGPAPGAPGCLIPGEIVARVTGEGPTGADALAMALQAHAPRAQVVTDDADLIE